MTGTPTSTRTITRSSSISATSRHIRSRVAFQAALIAVRRPSTASATTWTSMPLRTTVANNPKKEPRLATTAVAPLPPVPNGCAVSSIGVSSPSAARPSVISTGTTRNAADTRAASPTIAFGLRRIVLNAPSKKSPTPSGRRATTPGLCTGGPYVRRIRRIRRSPGPGEGVRRRRARHRGRHRAGVVTVRSGRRPGGTQPGGCCCDTMWFPRGRCGGAGPRHLRTSAARSPVLRGIGPAPI